MITLRLSPPSLPPESKAVHIPASVGKGCIRSAALASGIQLLVMDYTLDRPTRLEYAPPYKSTGFSFCLSGNSRIHSNGHGRDLIVRPGQSALNCCPDLDALWEDMAPQRVIRLGIMMNQELLDSFVPGSQDRPWDLTGMAPKGLIRREGRITPAMKVVILQILNCPFHGITRQLFLEAKALELAAYQMAQCLETCPLHRKMDRLRPGDRERAMQAADLLSSDLETAPNLCDLARSVGMCRSKLCHCFRLAYGVSPFEFLRRNRLETARNHLAQGRMNVTEAAYAVGYSSPSYFTKAFKKQFGHLPGRFPEKIR